MMSGNIGEQQDAYDRYDMEVYSTYLDDPFGSTCIGSYSNSNFNNFYHLNIVNSSSTYHNRVCSDDWHTFVRASIEMSYSILKAKYGKQENDIDNQESA